MMTTQGQRLFQTPIQRPQQPQQLMTPSHPSSLPRPSPSYQHYANLQQMQYQQSQLPDVTDYTPRMPSRHEDFRYIEFIYIISLSQFHSRVSLFYNLYNNNASTMSMKNVSGKFSLPCRWNNTLKCFK